ncbi:MAG: sulfotransferase [Candidatus Anammoxibacter sp.]
MHIKRILENCVEAFNLATVYLTSFNGCLKNRKLFKNIEAYCMFIGYPRSGHSLIGALLDAHPNMIIAHELGTLKYIHARFSKKQIFYLLLESSRKFAETGRKRKSYSYVVPNQWHGQYKKLRIIGDKQGEGATIRLQERSWLLRRLKRIVNGNVKLIHIIRNPYDNITTICMKANWHNLSSDLQDSIHYYFSLCETVSDIKKQIGDTNLFELRHESFVESPKNHLYDLCRFLGVDATDDYLNDCASIVYKSPHKSRYDVQWNQDLIDIVKRRVEKFPFLNGYCYDD